MKTGREQEAIVREILSKIFDVPVPFADDVDMKPLLSSKESREDVARLINQQSRQFHDALDGGWFAGVITETELRGIHTAGELIDLVQRHVNGQLEDDTWSAL